MAVGSTIGGYLPTLIGYSSFGVVSLLGSAVGGIAGVFAAQRIDADF
jgi:predicted MFS family arabinose efflux permease